MRLEGRIAIVTGGSRSIGRAICVGFAEQGAKVVVNHRDSQGAADDVVRSISDRGGEALAVQADVSVKADVDRLVETAMQTFGRIDILVNNAALPNRRIPFLDFPEEQWDAVLATDLKGYFLGSQAVARRMAEAGGGTIVNISSVLQDIPDAGNSAYCAAKGGVRMLTRQLALELADYRIRANAIAAGLIETDRNRAALSDPVDRERRRSLSPLKTIGTPEDLVGAAIFLASDESRLVTGTTIYVDAGASLI